MFVTHTAITTHKLFFNSFKHRYCPNDAFITYESPRQIIYVITTIIYCIMTNRILGVSYDLCMHGDMKSIAVSVNT